MSFKKEILSIIKYILFIFACIVFSFGFSILIQGPYFYNLTSKQNFDNLFDKVLIESFQNESNEICNLANISCSSFFEIVNGICNRSEEIKTYYNELISNISKYFNISEGNALTFVCAHNHELCQNITKIKEFSIQYETLCEEGKKHYEEIENKKEEIYNEKVFMNYSLSDINSNLKDSFYKGLGLLFFGLLLMYLSSKSFYKIAKSSTSIMLIIGLSWIVLGYFGENIITKGNILPKEIPKSFVYFISEIFKFEFISGFYVASFSSILLVFLIISKRFFWKNRNEKSKKDI